MLFWTDLVLWLPVIMVLYRHWGDEPDRREKFGSCVAVTVYLVPALYVFGWLLLPSWGWAPHLAGF